MQPPPNHQYLDPGTYAEARHYPHYLLLLKYMTITTPYVHHLPTAFRTRDVTQAKLKRSGGGPLLSKLDLCRYAVVVRAFAPQLATKVHATKCYETFCYGCCGSCFLVSTYLIVLFLWWYDWDKQNNRVAKTP